MKHLSSYLDKFRSITPPDDFLKSHILQLIKNKLGVDIDKKNIEISKGVVYIKTGPSIKNEIFIKKSLLLDEIKEISQKKIIKDIR